MHIVDPLPAGAMTFGGKTVGPAINMGRARPHQVGGRMVYLHLDELRDAVVKAGWHTEPDYQQMLVEHEALKYQHESLTTELEQAKEKIDALEKAIGFKPKPGRPKATATKD